MSQLLNDLRPVLWVIKITFSFFSHLMICHAQTHCIACSLAPFSPFNPILHTWHLRSKFAVSV